MKYIGLAWVLEFDAAVAPRFQDPLLGAIGSELIAP